MGRRRGGRADGEQHAVDTDAEVLLGLGHKVAQLEQAGIEELCRNRQQPLVVRVARVAVGGLQLRDAGKLVPRRRARLAHRRRERVVGRRLLASLDVPRARHAFDGAAAEHPRIEVLELAHVEARGDAAPPRVAPDLPRLRVLATLLLDEHVEWAALRVVDGRHGQGQVLDRLERAQLVTAGRVPHRVVDERLQPLGDDGGRHRVLAHELHDEHEVLPASGGRRPEHHVDGVAALGVLEPDLVPIAVALRREHLQLDRDRLLRRSHGNELVPKRHAGVSEALLDQQLQAGRARRLGARDELSLDPGV
mmetsp:Transcript_32867/g.104706  ORF Transcript_32867/g.104706 Transcript_32867/m.104706 type:complete len:307 (-) Transcript_32867:616-1536(-)